MADDVQGLRIKSAAGRWVVVATVMGSGVASLTATVVNVALPEIGDDLGAQVSGLQWILNGYLLALASLILLGGSLGDRYGRRRVFQVGVVWFAVASFACGAAPTVEVLVWARVLQGVGAALLTPGSLAILQASFAPTDRSAAIGAWSGFQGVTAAAGPLVGGYLVDAVSWRAAFFVNLPLAVAVFFIAARHVPESTDPTATGRLDVGGAALGALGLGGATYALIEAPERGLGSTAVLVAAVFGAVGLVGFVVRERRTRHPMLPPDIFASAQFTSANLVTFIVYAALGGTFFLFVVQLQAVLGYSPLEAGAASLPITVLMLALSARAGALAQRIGPRLPLTVGPLLIAAGLVLLGQVSDGTAYVTGVLPAVVVFGLGLSATVAPVTATVLAAADVRHSGVASGVNNAVARVAGLLAVAVLPVAAGIAGDDFADPAAFDAGFGVAMGITAALAATGGVVAWLTIRTDVLADAGAPPAGPPPPTEARSPDYHCGVDAPPLRARSSPSPRS